ncbi:MAG: hypothetical protein ACREFQ_13845, partial [Stellaceae bacterium]
SGQASSGGWGWGEYSGYDQGNSQCGGSSQPASLNGIDITDFTDTGTMSANQVGTDGNGGELWQFANGTQTATVDLFGNFTASGFSFATDHGIENAQATWQAGVTVGGGSAPVVETGLGTFIAYAAAGTSGSGGSSCDGGSGEGGGCSTPPTCDQGSQWFSHCS